MLGFLSSRVLGQYELFTPGSTARHRPAAAGRAEHRRRSSASSASTRTTSGSGCACTRRPTGCSSPRCLAARPPARRDRQPARATDARPGQVARASGVGRAARPARSAARGRRPSLHRRCHDPGAARDPRPGHRRDDAARGPRRRRRWTRSGRRWCRRSARSGRSSTSAAGGARRARRRCSAGCSASTSRWRSTATARAFVRAVVDEVGMDGFNAVWTSPETLPPPGRDRRPARLGDAGVHG